MPPELVDLIIKVVLLLGAFFGSGGAGAVVMRSWMKRIDRREKVAQDRERQQTETISALTNTIMVFVKSTQENAIETRANTQAIQELVREIVKGNEIQKLSQESARESNIILAKHSAANTQTIADLSKIVSDSNEALAKAISDSREAVSANSAQLATEIKGAVTQEVGKLDSAIAPLAIKVQEAILALTKAVEDLRAALEVLETNSADQVKIKALVQAAYDELRVELIKPVPADVLPGPTPPPESPKEPSAI